MTPAPDPGEVQEFRAARERVLARIAAACARAGRDPSDVTLVAVSKGFGVERVAAAFAAGLDVLGENRVQEAQPKVEALPAAEWHLVGTLQANKAGRALDLFSVIESVDSVALAARLDRLVRERGRPPFPVSLQVNVDGDPAKAGFRPEELEGAIADLAVLPGLELRGLMTVGWNMPTPEAARPTFVRLRALSEHLRASDAPLGPGLSMGMTDDFEVAVEEGATVVRVGRAIFGERPHAH